MYLFILESIGTSELLLIGIVALMFLGPRKLPGLARKAGQMMAEFRGTASEFKETWQREVNFEEEAKLLDINNLDAEPVERTFSDPSYENTIAPVSPTIKDVDPARLKDLKPAETPPRDDLAVTDSTLASAAATDDKKNWL